VRRGQTGRSTRTRSGIAPRGCVPVTSHAKPREERHGLSRAHHLSRDQSLQRSAGRLVDGSSVVRRVSRPVIRGIHAEIPLWQSSRAAAGARTRVRGMQTRVPVHRTRRRQGRCISIVGAKVDVRRHGRGHQRRGVGPAYANRAGCRVPHFIGPLARRIPLGRRRPNSWRRGVSVVYARWAGRLHRHGAALFRVLFYLALIAGLLALAASL
jgi:hypothetical protein